MVTAVPAVTVWDEPAEIESPDPVIDAFSVPELLLVTVTLVVTMLPFAAAVSVTGLGETVSPAAAPPLTQRGVICLQWRRLGGHHDSLFPAADLQRGVHTGANADLDLHIILNKALEPLRLDLHAIQPRDEVREGKYSATARLHRTGLVGT